MRDGKKVGPHSKFGLVQAFLGKRTEQPRQHLSLSLSPFSVFPLCISHGDSGALTSRAEKDGGRRTGSVKGRREEEKTDRRSKVLLRRSLVGEARQGRERGVREEERGEADNTECQTSLGFAL